MTYKTITNRTQFIKWADTALPGHTAIYHRSDVARNELLFQQARALFAEDKVILFQRIALDGAWEYCAQRCSSKTAGWLNRLSAAVHAPVNRYAYN